MARLPRLAVPGQAHFIIQRSHGGQAVLADAADRETLAQLLAQAAAAEQVQIHAAALLDTEVQLLCTPPEAQSLSRMMQAVGRRYVSAYNQRHRRSGALWDGRFRCAVVQAGATLLEVLCLIDGQAQDPIDLPRTTIGHRNGGQAWIPVADPPEYWALGNTPFDRERVYRELLIRGTSAERAQTLRSAALGGWALGSTNFAAQVAKSGGRPAAPRPRGRPRRPAG